MEAEDEDARLKWRASAMPNFESGRIHWDGSTTYVCNTCGVLVDESALQRHVDWHTKEAKKNGTVQGA